MACKKKKSHFSIKNVKKREERNVNMRFILRSELSKSKLLLKQKDQEITNLKDDQTLMRDINTKLEKSLNDQRKKTKLIAANKRKVQKKVVYYSAQARKKEGNNADETCLKQQSETIDMVETKVNGMYTADTRLCVMELTGLEVATGKIAPVMDAVGKLCNIKFSPLPSRQACQNIADEGQVVAKEFVKERVHKRSNGFGLHKDGTTSKKVKILDTSITTSNGESFCLGWSSVSSETEKAIAEKSQTKLEEVVGEVDERGELGELLKKLKYTMSDRAANEKKSNEFLENWEADTLRKNGDENSQKMHHLFCLAHVLLGFHSYTLNAITKLPTYQSQDYRHPINVLLKYASDLFGPVGDHRGLRPQWEAHCAANNIKSTIKSYKDNRFNGIFEVSAQVFHHHQDFINILESLKSLNFKQAKLLNSLKNKDMMLLLECLGLFFP